MSATAFNVHLVEQAEGNAEGVSRRLDIAAATGLLLPELVTTEMWGGDVTMRWRCL